MTTPFKPNTHRLFNLNIILLSLLSASCYAEGMTSTELPQVNVNAHKDKSSRDLQAKDVLGDGDVLTAHDLKTKRAVSLGQTLEKVGGVQNAGFGPNTGLPQIRSLSGSRVYISENGMGVSDMAAISGNLPTMVNPFLADKITVLKSSAAVLYGGNAIGGAVDVDTGVIPHKLPEQDFGGKIELSGGYNTPHNEAFRFDGKTGNFAWHLDASNSQISGYRIPGSSKPDLCYDPANRLNSRLMWSCQITPVITEELNPGYYRYVHKGGRAWLNELEKKYGEHLDDSEMYKLNKPAWGNSADWIDNPLYDGSKEFRKTTVHAMRDDTPVREGRLGNSSLKNRSVSFGGSYIGERGHIGAAVSRSLYRSGIPGFSYYNIDGNGNRKLAAEPASVYSQQTRWLVDALYRPQSSWVDNVSFLTSYTDTPNTELLGSTKVNSLDSRTLQNRIELNHHFSSLFNGSIGADYKRRHTESSGLNGKRTGNYSYLPDTNSREYGIFVLENLKYRNYEASLGWRYGNVRHGLDLDSYKTARNTDSQKGLEKRSSLKYSLNSFHASTGWKPLPFWKINARYSRSQRAPEINELYAGGSHYAQLASENYSSDSVLRPETARTWEFGNEFEWNGGKLRANYYQTRFNDYIYLSDVAHDGGDRLPTKYWRAADTRIQGLEIELTQLFDLKQYGQLELRLFADRVRNHADDKDSRNADSNRLRNDGYYMPNLPVSRYGLGASWNKGAWQIGSSLTRYAAAKHTGNMAAAYKEPSLGSYALLDAYVSHTQKHGRYSTEWFLDGRNLTNRTARAQNSILKYIAPLPGRSIRAGVKISL